MLLRLLCGQHSNRWESDESDDDDDENSDDNDDDKQDGDAGWPPALVLKIGRNSWKNHPVYWLYDDENDNNDDDDDGENSDYK